MRILMDNNLKFLTSEVFIIENDNDFKFLNFIHLFKYLCLIRVLNMFIRALTIISARHFQNKSQLILFTVDSASTKNSTLLVWFNRNITILLHII